MPIRREGGLREEQITQTIIGAFFSVYRELGFGYREFIYALALEQELIARGLRVQREVAVMIYYRGKPLVRQTMDMLVEGKVIVENKSRERLPPESTAQLFGYLCHTTMEVGLVLHFGREAKFYRMFCDNQYKAHFQNKNRHANPDATGADGDDSQAIP